MVTSARKHTIHASTTEDKSAERLNGFLRLENGESKRRKDSPPAECLALWSCLTYADEPFFSAWITIDPSSTTTLAAP